MMEYEFERLECCIRDSLAAADPRAAERRPGLRSWFERERCWNCTPPRKNGRR